VKHVSFLFKSWPPTQTLVEFHIIELFYGLFSFAQKSFDLLDYNFRSHKICWIITSIRFSFHLIVTTKRFILKVGQSKRRIEQLYDNICQIFGGHTWNPNGHCIPLRLSQPTIVEMCFACPMCNLDSFNLIPTPASTTIQHTHVFPSKKIKTYSCLHFQI